MSAPYFVVRPTELPFHQRNLTAWWQGERGHLYAEGFIEATRGKYGGDGLFLGGTSGDYLARMEAQRVLTRRRTGSARR